MKRPTFFRRRAVWVPTVWTWALLCLCIAAGALFALRNVYGFLAPSEPLGSRLLVVEGWMPYAELDQSLRAFERGKYQRVVTTGGPIENERARVRAGADSYAEEARNHLLEQGLASDAVVAVPAPASAQDRSFLNAVMVREWALATGFPLDSVDVFSSGVHSRRSRLLHGLAFGPGVRVGIIAATPSEYDPHAWWRTSLGAKEVLGEAIGWLWTELFFHPAPPGSQDERWRNGEGG